MTNSKNKRIANYLSASSTFQLGIWCLIAGFGTYFSMYAFRKPFNAVTYEGFEVFGSALKPILIVSQIIGYMASKFIGVKVISELKNNQRSRFMIGFILFSLTMLVGFAFAPIYLKPLFIFGSALPLGMFWGIVFSYFEGRRFTEFFAIGLSISAIVSSGVLKSFSRVLFEYWGFSDFMVPLIAGILFLPIIIFFIWMLAQIPAPQKLDLADRSIRTPLKAKARVALFKKYALGLSLLIIIYVVLTVIRDFRDNYAVELMHENGFAGNPEVFAQSEIIIGILVLLSIALIVKIKSHIKGLKMVLLLCGSGLLLVAVSTFLLEQKLISPFVWMVAQGFGIYAGYVPFQIALFERFLAAFKEPGNVGFLMYISDSSGYLGSVILSLLIQSSTIKINWTDSFVHLSYLGGLMGLIMVILAFNYFQHKWKSNSLNLAKPLLTLSLLFLAFSYPIYSKAGNDPQILWHSSSYSEDELIKSFRHAAAQFPENPEEAKQSFVIAFNQYERLNKKGQKFSEQFYQEALVLSRKMRLISISRRFIDDMNIAYPSKKEHCDCGKCHKEP